MSTHNDYPKASSFPVHCLLLLFWTMPRDSCSLPAPWCPSQLAEQRYGRNSSPKGTTATAAAETHPAAARAVPERWDTAASAQHRAQTVTPRTAAMCPCSTHSNQLQGEAIWVQFSDVSAVSVRRIRTKLKAVTPVSPQSISVRCSALQRALLCALLALPQGCRRLCLTFLFW